MKERLPRVMPPAPSIDFISISMLHFYCRDFIQSRTSPFHGFNVSITIHCGFSCLQPPRATCPRERLREISCNEDQPKSDEAEQNPGETAKISISLINTFVN